LSESKVNYKHTDSYRGPVEPGRITITRRKSQDFTEPLKSLCRYVHLHVCVSVSLSVCAQLQKHCEKLILYKTICKFLFTKIHRRKSISWEKQARRCSTWIYFFFII